jgi:UDP-N-acetylmuramate dehydrogenase
MMAPSRFIELAASLERELAGNVRTDVAVGPMTSFRVGGRAAVVIEPGSAEDLAQAGALIAQHGAETLVLGRGTNLLVSDRGFPGVLIRLGKPFDWISERDGDRLEAGGATALPQVANKAARLSLSGLEFAIAIPAAVGGAVRMNAGAHSASLADVLESVKVCRLQTGEIADLGTTALGMTYRRSSLGASDVVCSAVFKLQPESQKLIAERMAEYREHRAETQPVEAPNAGSMFKNPPETTAGSLIERAGLKGFRLGNAEVSRKHANFFLAHPGATAQEIYTLMTDVQKKVKEEFGVLLIPEVRPVGEFDPPMLEGGGDEN